ncbi:MAG: DUF4981 domain-containing protein [Alistipes sp.]|nr:DUF4981 domain-containing protein [Alistipes sp.]
MKPAKLLLCALLICTSATAQTERWLDPNIFEVGRLPMRSSFIVYPTVDEVQYISDFRSSPQYRSIGGVWQFHWADTPAEQPEMFYRPGFDTSSWGTMPVPGMWEMNGYGDPVYTNIPYPWHKFFADNPPYVPVEQNHVGSYLREIEVPAEWKGRDIFVHIGSATSNLTLWVNGREVGYSEDSKLEAEFDITRYVKCGEKNLFAMRIMRWCDGSYLEDQDFWHMTGIGRDCYIYSRDKRRMTDIKLTPDLVNGCTDGLLDIEIGTTRGIRSVALRLVDSEGNTICERNCPVDGGSVKTRFEVAAPRKWSAEEPNLYRLSVAASDGKQIVEATGFNVGFRKVEIAGGQLLVNGRPIYIKGVNRHEMNPNTGYYLTREDMVNDIETIKRLNFNAVRTCHYPNAPLWYDLCDIYGIYLVDEADIESHGMGYAERTLAAREDYLAAHLARNQRMVMRDYNHPSIIIWSMGNEAGNGHNFYKCYEWIKSYDKSRPVQYERAETDFDTDIYCPMYAGYDYCRQYASGNPSRPLIQCEYAHAMGNSLGGFKEYWDLVRKYPAYQGGFIWDFADQALAYRDPATGILTYRYGGDYNEYDASDGTFNCNGVVAPNRDWHPGAYEVKYQQRNILTRDHDVRNGRVEIFNENFFIDLSKYRLHWQLLVDGAAAMSGTVEHLDVAPQQTAVVSLGYTAADIDALAGDEILLDLSYTLKRRDALLQAGYEVAYDQIEVKSCDMAAHFGATAAEAGALRLDSHTVTGDRFRVEFGSDGFIAGYRYDGIEMLCSALRPSFYRAPVDNDDGARHNTSHNWFAWRNVEPQLQSFAIDREGSDIVATAAYIIVETGAALEMTYRICPGGEVIATESMTADKSRTDIKKLMRFGMTMAMPSMFDTVEFYGAGPFENYCDRLSGARIGHYVQSVDEQFYPLYVRPQESGTHCALRWWQIRDSAGRGLEIRSDKHFSASAIPYSPESIDIMSPVSAKHFPELEKDGCTYVNFDLKQQGVGCVNSWNALPREEHTLPYDDYRFTFMLRPLR